MIDKDLLKYTKGKNYYLIFITLLSFLLLIVSVSSSFLLSSSIDLFIKNENSAYIYLFSSFALVVLFIIFYILKGKLADNLANYVSSKIRDDIFNKYVLLEGRSKLTTSEISQLSSEGVEQLRLYYSSYLPSFFYSMLAPISLFVLFCFFDYKVAIIYLVCVTLIPISIILVSKWAKKLFNTYWDKYLSLGSHYLDSVSGMKELLIFSYDNRMQEEMKKSSEDFRRITMKVLVMQLFSTTIMDLVAYGGAAVGITLTLLSFKDNSISLVLTIFMILVGAEFFLPLRALGSSFHIAMNGATAGKKVISLLNEKEIKDGDVKLDTINKIEISDLSFRYEDADANVFSKNLNMTFEKGFTSILGNSGCGKSTLANILATNIKGYSGSIKIDGKELNTLNRYEYRKHICYISTDTYLLNKSVRDSFKFYNKNLNEEEMLSFLDQVSLKERIISQGGLDHIFKTDYEQLSGGEKQRLILAYYLSVNKEIMIFDETTSNIDKESEKIIVDAIKILSKNKIIIFISHRYKNALYADKIYKFDNENGSLICGSPSNLLIENPDFKNQIETENRWEEII